MSTKTDMSWANDQLNLAGFTGNNPARQQIRNSVELLLRELNEQNHEDRETKLIVLDLFHRLATDQDIVPRQVQDVGARWVDFLLGDVKPGATVRVRHDAYEGSAGATHNNMVGRLVAARGGEAVVQYAESSDGAGHRHDPDKLEVLEVQK